MKKEIFMNFKPRYYWPIYGAFLTTGFYIAFEEPSHKYPFDAGIHSHAESLSDQPLTNAGFLVNGTTGSFTAAHTEKSLDNWTIYVAD